MTDLFDKNGNATETHVATVSGFDSINGELTATYEVRIFEGTGAPGFSTLKLAPAAESGHAVCWDGEEWNQVIDLRGSIVYEKSNTAAITVKDLGPLKDELTEIAPLTTYDKWVGQGWVTDSDAQKAAALAAAQLGRSTLLTAANNEIAWRQDAVDAGIATDEEKTALIVWKTYRVNLMRIDTTKATDIDWPIMPS